MADFRRNARKPSRGRPAGLRPGASGRLWPEHHGRLNLAREDRCAARSVREGATDARRPMIAAMAGWRLEHTYTGLPDLFYSEARSTPVANPQLVVFNTPLATLLGLDAEALNSPEGAMIFAGNTLPHGARPIAQ